MKSFFTTKSVAVPAILAGAIGFSAPGFSAEVAKITVNGMVCSFCAQGIEKTLSKMPHTQSVYVNLDKRLVAVEAKAGHKLDLAPIKKGIVDSGYDVVAAELVNDSSVAAIKADMKGKK